MGNINCNNKLTLHIGTPKIMKWTKSFSCLRTKLMKISHIIHIFEKSLLRKVIPRLNFFVSHFLCIGLHGWYFKIVPNVLHWRSKSWRSCAQKMASHDLTLLTGMTKNLSHNSYEANSRTILEMLWIDIGIRNMHLLNMSLL